MRKILALASICIAIAAVPRDAHAGHHPWIITEVYSNHDGTIQFVELKGTADNEAGLNGFNLTTAGTIPTTVPLGPNLPSPLTNGKYLLVATTGYATLAALQGAPAPDRTMPNNFLQIAADSVTYAGIGSTTRAYTNLPINGVDSLDFENPGSTVNSPQSWDNAIGGTITASPPPPPPSPVPALPRWGLVLLIGCFVGGAAFVLRHRANHAAG